MTDTTARPDSLVARKAERIAVERWPRGGWDIDGTSVSIIEAGIRRGLALAADAVGEMAEAYEPNELGSRPRSYAALLREAERRIREMAKS